ncbi:hypothetical protein [Hymenobacter persicinus]|uniref:Uncharacterized protein n=1 Tax=Hymenobacter persicinus TaxID=2025506 RepID=A0A4Q5L8Q0_9BACT|nr:hypothetical protein [Hymenobacter persicinus]RYU78055.1 hypothetical protein EWM57_15560 [Hymenobacter persicinus]
MQRKVLLKFISVETKNLQRAGIKQDGNDGCLITQSPVCAVGRVDARGGLSVACKPEKSGNIPVAGA